MSPRFARTRRLTVLVTLVSFLIGGVAEPIAAVVRDGVVHHESTAVAATHSTASIGDHGHEDGPSDGTHPHTPEHQHGTTGDHCTHAHGLGTVSVYLLGISQTTGTLDSPHPVGPHPVDRTSPTPPPRS